MPFSVFGLLSLHSRYGENLYHELQERGYVLRLLHPRQTHQFHQRQGLRAKTDRLDAMTIAKVLLSGEARAGYVPSERVTVSAKEELFQRRGEHVVSRAVVLTFQGATLRIRENGGKLLRPVAQKHMTFLTTQEHRAVHHERGDRDGSPLTEWQRVASLGISHDGDVVSERVRHFLEPRPHGRLPHLDNHFGRRAHLGHEVLDRFAPATRRDQFHEVLRVILRGRRPTVVNDKRGLVHRQLRDFGGKQARGLKGQDRAGGMAKDERRSPSLADQGIEIFDLALDRVRRCVPTLAPATPVIGEYREVRRKARRQ
jgi:hypothetical protein